MARFAPTLFVGLGGSGVGVLRWIKWIAGGATSLAGEPLAFRALDLDSDSNRASAQSAPPLEPDEFFYLDPISIADCVRSLTTHVMVANARNQAAHDAIRDWYPDLEGESIRYGQAEAAGARQWRALGRVGFFMNDEEILVALQSGLTDLDQRRKNTEAYKAKPAALIVSSLSGGTGAGMLLDIAATLRRERPNLAVRAVLLLPEFFDQIDFAGKVSANAYALLWELASFKNQHLEFIVRYPRIPGVDARQATPPLQRIYVIGPYLGDRRPYSMPQKAHPRVASQIVTMLTEAFRGDSASYQTNADADGGAPLDDSASHDIFCSFSGADIRLISYDDFAKLLARALANEIADPSADHQLLDSMASPYSPQEIVDLHAVIFPPDYISQAAKSLSPEAIDEAVDAFFNNAPSAWKPKSLASFMDDLRTFCSEFPEDWRAQDLSRSALVHGPLAMVRERFVLALRANIEAVRQRLELHPHAFNAVIRDLRDRTRRDLHLAQPPAVGNLADFEKWLKGSPAEYLLGLPLLRHVRIPRLRKHVKEGMKARFHDPERICEQTILDAAVDELQAVLDTAKTAWMNSEAFRDRVVTRVDAELVTHSTRDLERGSLGPTDVDVHALFEEELRRVPEQTVRTRIRRRILETLRSKFIEFGSRPELADKLPEAIVAEMRELRMQAGTSSVSSFLSPSITYGEEAIRGVVLSCTSKVFRAGRVDAFLRHRTVRMIIPNDFAQRAEFERRLAAMCRSLLGATVQPASAATDENYVRILVEDLFHPAENIVGIYDYYNDYSKRARRELFHIDRRIVPLLPALLAASGSRGPVYCGNVGCKKDIASLSRTRLICPHCGRPIRNRCGNAGCRLDDLTAAHRDIEAIILADICPNPDCRRPLRTYWWRCSRHGTRVAMEKPHCPFCVRAGILPERRPGYADRYMCPGCTHLGVKQPFRVDGATAHACKYGANGQQVDETLREAGQVLANGRSCPKCGSRLLALCPIEDGSAVHFLHRTSRRERWHCYTHADATFYTCGNCESPLRATQAFCPRCTVELEECRFCTPVLGLRIAKGESADRCTHCGVRRRVEHADGVNQSDVFCSNIFACAMGAALEVATLPQNTKSCPLCHSTSRIVLPVYSRRDTVSACSFCRKIFTGVADQAQAPRIDEASCRLCGQVYSEASRLANDTEQMSSMLTVGRALIHNRSNDAALRDVYTDLRSDKRASIAEVLAVFANRIAQRAAHATVAPRIDAMIAKALTFTSEDAGRAATSASPAAGASDPQPNDLLSPDYFLGLKSEEDVRNWLEELRQMQTSADSIKAVLGAAMAKAMDEEARRRFERFRDVVRNYLDEFYETD